jgi:hypothetical protein
MERNGVVNNDKQRAHVARAHYALLQPRARVLSFTFALVYVCSLAVLQGKGKRAVCVKDRLNAQVDVLSCRGEEAGAAVDFDEARR